jgi:hypothetical protein
MADIIKFQKKPVPPVPESRVSLLDAGWGSIGEMLTEAVMDILNARIPVGGVAVVVYDPVCTTIYRYKLSAEELAFIANVMYEEHPAPTAGAFTPE